MTDMELRKNILELAQNTVSLNKRGGPGKASKLFEKVINEEKEILEKIGLPDTPYYQGLLRFESIPWDNEINELIDILKKEKEAQNKKDTSSGLDLLKEAKKSDRDPMFILPQLGITTHVYTLFVYNEILMYGKDEPKNILNELKTANNPEILDITGRMDCDAEWLKNPLETISSLEKKGLKYIRQYAMEKINFLKNMGFKINGF